jgi:exopolyphosphatase / guanosine-5'-triphosphate,3'-diphosphate pyrophosphatase
MSDALTSEELPETVAAVDLGSNSFHMVIARVQGGQVQILDRLKEMVRLAGGLGPDNNLNDDARERALETLTRFGERVRGMEVGSVRAFGTNTLRKARNARAFLDDVEDALGHPVEIISGLEEARLVYMGVAYSLQSGPGRRLVIDIGGGSTEFIIGQGFEPQHRDSKYMGCVSYSRAYFPDGLIDEARFERAVLAARQELESMAARYSAIGWDFCIGASGTIKAIGQICEATGYSRGGITLAAMQKIRRRLIKLGKADSTKIAGLGEERVPVFPGGLAILIAAFESLGIKRMLVSDGALREGLMYDLIGRMHEQDVRDQTVANMCARYGIDVVHARRVERTALALLDQVKDDWELDEQYWRKILRWSALLHEIGLAVTHANYHKHGSYLVENSDMPGFSRQDQQLLWALIRSHRRSFKPHRYVNMANKVSRSGKRLTILLRLAHLLNRNRRDDFLPPIKVQVTGRTLELIFPAGWLETMPLTLTALEEEASLLAAGKFKLVFHSEAS